MENTTNFFYKDIIIVAKIVHKNHRYITVIIGHYICDVEWMYIKYTLEDRNTHWEHFGIDLGFKWEGHWMGTR